VENRASDVSRRIELVATILPVSAALLPILGAIVRLVAFTLDRNIPPLLAFAAPFPVLVATGLPVLAIWVAQSGMLAIAGLAAPAHRLHRVIEMAPSKYRKWVRLVLLVVTLGLLFWILGNSSPAILPPALAVAVLYGWGEWVLVRSNFRLRSLLPALTVMLTVSAVGLGLFATPGERQEVTFAGSLDGIENGVYFEIARGDGLVYLLDCSLPTTFRAIVAIRPDQIESVRVLPTSQESFATGEGGLRWGPSYACPEHKN
jgi:hypothetical protein